MRLAVVGELLEHVLAVGVGVLLGPHPVVTVGRFPCSWSARVPPLVQQRGDEGGIDVALGEASVLGRRVEHLSANFGPHLVGQLSALAWKAVPHVEPCFDLRNWDCNSWISLAFKCELCGEAPACPRLSKGLDILLACSFYLRWTCSQSFEAIEQRSNCALL